MNNYYYLKSLKPRYSLLVIFILVSFIVIIGSIFLFKIYDVYNIKGFVECSDYCRVSFVMDCLDVNKFVNIDELKINNKIIVPIKTDISEIMVDQNSKSNYQIVNLEVNQLDDGILNTFQDVRVYSNKELIINKIVKVLL